VESFIRGIPKAELHLHIEGSLEPEMMFEMALRNGVDLRFSTVGEVRAAYEFTDLQSFLDIYYEGAAVLQTERDFYDLTMAYLRRAAGDGVRRAEIFFDPQTHTGRGIAFDTVVSGIHHALRDGEQSLGISSGLIMCFLRHLSAEDAMETLGEAINYIEWIDAVGLDSSEVGNPPSKFVDVFARAKDAGFLAVAHAGEEGPADYISDSLELLGATRIDHGIRCLDDSAVVARLAAERVPLTVCPLSNVRLRVFDTIKDHSLRVLMDAGLLVTINSDDPAYFGGYVGDNYLAVARGLDLSRDDIVQLARNSFEAAFISADQRDRYLAEIDAFVAAAG
jgi:adenosine deaminase